MRARLRHTIGDLTKEAEVEGDWISKDEAPALLHDILGLDDPLAGEAERPEFYVTVNDPEGGEMFPINAERALAIRDMAQGRHPTRDLLLMLREGVYLREKEPRPDLLDYIVNQLSELAAMGRETEPTPEVEADGT